MKNQHPNYQPSLLKDHILTISIALAISWYLLMCILHLCSLRPLWNDEDCVFQSIQHYGPYEMFHQKLMAVQVFPRVYLFLIQQFSKLFDFHLLALRLPSFLCMISAFFIWLKIASLELKNKLSYLTFVLCWGASAVLIYYSAELKQYSMDVLAASLFILFLYHQESLERGPKGKYIFILVILPLLGFFSYPASFLLVFPLWNIFLSAKDDRKNLLPIIIYFLSCAAVLVTAYFFDMRLRPVSQVTEGFGDYFISTVSAGEFFKTFGEGTMNLISRWFVERPKLLKSLGNIFIFLGVFRMFYGFFGNIKKDNYRIKQIGTLALLIYLELFCLGLFKKYPFTVPRTSLFFCPILLCLTVQGIEDLKKIHPWLKRMVNLGFLYYLVFVSIGISLFVFAGQMSQRPVLW